MGFYVGQKLVCVDDTLQPGVAPWRPEDKPVVGNIYRIRQVTTDTGYLGLRLFEFDRPNTYLGIGPWGAYHFPDLPYFASRFRPLVERKTSIEIFQRLLLPSEKEKELETMTGNPNL